MEDQKYYFKTKGWNNQDCVEPCRFLDNGTMIGSIKCQECKHCAGIEETNSDFESPNWIKCEKIKP